jgi:hypothetical protein
LLQYICQSTCTDTSKPILWTDSTVTLGWIRQDPNRWKIFICNRITEIQAYTTPSQWRHCPGKENPTDLLSRGVTGDQLKTSELWWNGPSWLVQHPKYWPQITHALDVSLTETKDKNVVNKTSRRLLVTILYYTHEVNTISLSRITLQSLHCI